MDRPEKTEYNDYYETYMSLVDETEIVAALELQLKEMREIFREISEEKSDFAYAAGKWTIKQLVGHMIDTERIFGYRALRISRGDASPIEGFEQDAYVENAPFEDYKFSELADEFECARRVSISFFRHLGSDAWRLKGTASGSPVSVRALAYMMVGHVRHHTKILKERYLS